jgi:lipid-A-disaccharide synthase-like uncharacterized protein
VELTHLRRIERLNLVLAGVLAAGSLMFWRRDIVLGTALGALLAVLNFWVIRRVTARVLASASARKQLLLMSLLVAKMSLLIGLVFVIIRYAPVHVVAFVVGLSTFLASILLASLAAPADPAAPPPRRRRRTRSATAPVAAPATSTTAATEGSCHG